LISVGIIGGTGYTGKYLIKFLQKHKNVYAFDVYGKNNAGKKLYDLFPSFQGFVENKTVLPVNDISFEHQIYFVSLPHGESMNLIPALLNKNKKVIDLGGDFRLDDKELYDKWYGFEHKFPEYLKLKQYGLADINGSLLKEADFIANPGCYPTSVLLGLYPLIKNFNDQVKNISVVSYSGTSGAGKKARADLLFSEMFGNVKAYSVNKHRHQPEIEQELKKIGFNGDLSFTTHLLPVERGIYSTITVYLENEADKDEIISEYEKQYNESEFIRLRKTPPELKWVVETNYCDINVSVRNNSVIITSALDNLIKGAAGQAVQNLNNIYGWNSSTGLK